MLWGGRDNGVGAVDAILPAWELSVLHCLTTIPLLTSEARTGLTLNRVLTTEKRYDGFLSGTNGGLTEKMVWARSSASL
jgi:hypothetical protein